ncbi:hypothetical protein [Ekhidna sp.]|uniref:hypothetical protein n=1 Tax=Ekhidna sp. TaxID=2608089 RepID=UPI003B50FCBB
MKSFISFLLLTLTIQLSAQTKIIKFEAGHLTVEVANKWIGVETRRSLALNQKSKPENLQITYGFSDNSSLDEFYKENVVESFPNEFENFKIIEEKEHLINDRKFKSVLFNSTGKGITFQTIVYMTMNNGNGYVFIGTSTPSRMSENSQEFYDIVSSTKFLSPNNEPIVKNEKLELVYGKRWILKSQDLGFGNFPVSSDSKFYFELTDNKISQAKTDNSQKCEVVFSYDNSSNTITFFCRGRNLTRQILKVTANTLTTKEIDEVGDTLERTYQASK